MSALLERRRQDLSHLRRLEASSGGRIRLVRGDERSSRIVLELRYRTAASKRFPEEALTAVQVTVELPEDYPFSPPAATLSPVVFHPNVFASGRVCMGTKWLPAEGLDLFVRRVAEVVTFRPELVNLSSPASAEAAAWFRAASLRSPSLFPTDTVTLTSPPPERPAMKWKDVEEPEADKPCPGCGRRLRVSAVPGNRVRCPACRTVFAWTR